MSRTLFVVTFLSLAVAARGQVNNLSTLTTRHLAVSSQPATCGEVRAALEDDGTPAPASKLPLSYFGVGIGGVSNTGATRVSDTAIVNGKIVVTSDDNLTLGPVLEAHALVFTMRNLWATHDAKGRLYVLDDKPPCEAAGVFPTIAHGPFVVTRVGDNEIVKSLGVGWMVGFRIKQTDASLNVGLAYTLESNVKRLAKGFEEGQPLPTGETAVRFRTGRGTALALVVSFGF